MKLDLPRRTKKRVPARERQSMDVPAAPNRIWALDFMSDALYHGRRFRALNVLDEGVREALDIVIDTSIPSGRVVRVLEQLKGWRGLPLAIRCDNGPEILSPAFVEWCLDHGVEVRYIQPGKPIENALFESFNGRLRDECLNVNEFVSMEDVRHRIEAWRLDYNHRRPHGSLGNLTPSGFAEQGQELASGAAAL